MLERVVEKENICSRQIARGLNSYGKRGTKPLCSENIDGLQALYINQQHHTNKSS